MGDLAVKNVRLYLEGPGQELRPVKLLSTERVDIRTTSIPRKLGLAAENAWVDLNVLVDEQGNEAKQVDAEGFKYRFNGSAIPWSLVVA